MNVSDCVFEIRSLAFFLYSISLKNVEIKICEFHLINQSIDSNNVWFLANWFEIWIKQLKEQILSFLAINLSIIVVSAIVNCRKHGKHMNSHIYLIRNQWLYTSLLNFPRECFHFWLMIPNISVFHRLRIPRSDILTVWTVNCCISVNSSSKSTNCVTFNVV